MARPRRLVPIDDSAARRVGAAPRRRSSHAPARRGEVAVVGEAGHGRSRAWVLAASSHTSQSLAPASMMCWSQDLAGAVDVAALRSPRAAPGGCRRPRRASRRCGGASGGSAGRRSSAASRCARAGCARHVDDRAVEAEVEARSSRASPASPPPASRRRCAQRRDLLGVVALHPFAQREGLERAAQAVELAHVVG
jgi:hypothetical protein